MDDWEVASRDDLAEWASAQAEFASDDCEGDIDVYLVADQVIWIRENHNGMGANWDAAYKKLGEEFQV